MNNKGTDSQLPLDSSTSSNSAQITSSDSPIQSHPYKGSYLAAMILVGGIIQVPVVASIITVLAYLTPSYKNVLGVGNYNWSVLALGIIGSLLIWLILSSFCMRFTTSIGANADEYGRIQNQLLCIKPKATAWHGNHSATSTVSTDDYDTNLMSLDGYIKAIEQDLSNNDQRWVLGYGYIRVWEKVHRAEEVMFSLMSREDVIQEALYDELCLTDSNISNSKTLLSRLRIAAKTLSSDVSKYLITDDQVSNSLFRAKEQSQESNSDGKMTPQAQAEAVVVLKQCRRNINEFSDNHWDAVIRARNQLIVSALITSTFTFILLCIPIIQNVDISLIVSAVIFYLVGSITGFFSRLYDESKNPTALNDYGLSRARLFVIPVLSGFAGIAGIFIRAQLAPVAPTTASLFELSLQNIVVAATFGFSPNLVVSALQSQTKKYLEDLESIQSPGKRI